MTADSIIRWNDGPNKARWGRFYEATRLLADARPQRGNLRTGATDLVQPLLDRLDPRDRRSQIDDHTLRRERRPNSNPRATV
jgi:hypothetical protein